MSLIAPFLSLFLIFIGLFAAYLVIRIAVRHGIDSSEVGQIIKENARKKVN